MSAYEEQPSWEPRTEGVLQVQPGREQTSFAIGSGPWVYVTPSQVRDAQDRLERDGTGVAHLLGYWLDEQDLAALR